MTNSTWNLDAPPGFRGLREDLPLTVYYRHLPHWRQDGATYFVTFRLADSLPQSKLRELEGIKREWLARHGIHVGTGCKPVLRGESLSRHEWDEYSRIVMEKVDVWLDRGMGECWLKAPELARIVVDDLHHGDSHRYELGCYVTMPNHVHAIIRPLDPQAFPLEKVLHGCKRHSSRQINIQVGRTGVLWQEESLIASSVMQSTCGAVFSTLAAIRGMQSSTPPGIACEYGRNGRNWAGGSWSLRRCR